MPGPAPRSTMRPRHPSSRRVTAALPPASPVPTMTTICSPVALAFIVLLTQKGPTARFLLSIPDHQYHCKIILCIQQQGGCIVFKEAVTHWRHVEML